MDNDYLAQLEMTLDDFRTRIKALEDALTRLPNVNMQPDPSRTPGVVVEPAPLNGL